MSTLVQVLWYLDFGLSFTASRHFAYATGGASTFSDSQPEGPAGPNEESIRRLYRTVRALFVPLGLGVAVVIGFAGGATLVRPIHQLAEPHLGWLAWLVVVVGSGCAFMGLTYSCYLQGSGQIAVVRRWEALMNIGAILTSICALLLGGGLFTLAVAGQGWALLGVIRNRWLTRLSAPTGMMDARLLNFDGAVFRTLWRSAWRSGTGVLLNAGVVRMSAGLLAQWLDPVTLAAYLLAFNMLDRLTQFSMAPFYSKLPEFAIYYSRGDRAILGRRARNGGAFTLAIFVCGALAVGAVAEPALRFVGSSTPFIGLPFWILMTLAMSIHRFGAMHLQLYTLSDQVVWHIADGVSGALFFVSWTVAFHWLGVLAIPVGMLIGYGCFYTPFSVLLCNKWWARWCVNRFVEEGALSLYKSQ